MYRESHPTSAADRPSSPRASMLADMSYLPSMSSRSATVQPYTSHKPYERPSATLARSEMPAQHHLARESQVLQSHAQQLPSLRTLLEPELLDKKPLENHSQSSGAFQPQASATKYGSASPTLKRRHDFDSYSSENGHTHATASRMPPVHRHAQYTANTGMHTASFSTSTLYESPQSSGVSRNAGLPGTTYTDSTTQAVGPPSIASAFGTPSDSVRAIPRHIPLHDDLIDPNKSARRRMEGSARTQVRPRRCVDQREIEGEGLCYIFEDGSYCRVVIDGEPVNPSWGVTKAGKPRKRLAQACLTCREKKIKCEPGYPKCHQCAKSQRICRGGLSQSSMSNASGETSPSASSAAFKPLPTELVSPVAGLEKHRALDEHYPKAIPTWTASTPLKTRNFRPSSVATSRDMSVHSLDSDWSGSMNNDDRGLPSYQDQLAAQWEQDPYESNPRLTMHLLDLYFLHAGRATYGMFPRRPFLAWVENNREKSQDHLMLLYSVLAMGSVFSEGHVYRAPGKLFAAIAAYALEKRFGKFTLQLCQSRLILALYNFARGKSQEAWDFCGAGLRALSALKLNTEDGVKELPETAADTPYGFDRLTLEECCRRTFWSGFLMDRYNGFCGGTLCVINIEDTFLRLPCLEHQFEASAPCETALFDVDLLQHQGYSGPPLGYMAHLVLISTIWGDVLSFTSRSVHRSGSGYERQYENFYAKTYERLEAWLNMLPPDLRYTPQNLDKSITEGFAGSFISLHALHHTALIRLNRHIRVSAFPADKLARNVEQTYRNALSYVAIMHSLAAENRQRRLPPHTAAEFLFSTPFPGYALMLSIDVITAAGSTTHLSNLIEMLGPANSCLEELATYWASARTQQKAVGNRIQRLAEIALQDDKSISNGTFGKLWRITDSMETAFGNDDAVYQANDRLLSEIVQGFNGR